MVRSGFLSVQAMPMTWQASTFGGLNLFREEAVGFEHQLADCRALADAVTLLLVSAPLRVRQEWVGSSADVRRAARP